MKEQDFDKIEAYLSGDMNESEASLFDKEIAQNSELAVAVDRHLVAHDAIEVMIEKNLRSEMESWREEEKQEATVHNIGQKKEKATIRRLAYRFAAAASIALLMGFFALQFSSNNYSNIALSENAYNYDLSTSRSTTTTQNALAPGLEAYENGNYSEAIQYFQNIPVGDANHTEALFYLGHSYYQNKNYNTAISTFQQVAATKDIRYIEAAEWYQVVNTLAAGKVDANFNVLLNKIADDRGHTYHNNAIELRSQLNSFWRKLRF